MRLTGLVACLALAGCGRVDFDVSGDASGSAVADASPVPTLVQQRGTAATNIATLSLTLDAAPAIGHILVLVGAGHIAPLQSVAGGSSAWVRAVRSASYANIEIWYGPTDGSSTITIDVTGLTGMTLWVGEWAGLAATNTLDDSIASAGLASPASAGSITTSASSELVLFAVNDYTPNTYGTPTGGSWESPYTVTTDSVQSVWLQIAAAPGPVAPTVEETNHRWDAALAAFRASP